MKLTLAAPVTPFRINQVFGINPLVYARFGLAGHNGIDLHTYHGQPVYAAHDGIANYEVDNSQGHGVDVVSTTKYDNGYAKTRYWHLCDPKKEPEFKSPIYGKKNVKVKAGDVIGFADNTGFSTGDHLHFGYKPQGKNTKGVYYNLHPDNGFKGATDPLPFFKKEDDQFRPGGTSPLIRVFQGVLQDTGFFPKSTTPTDFWGPITDKAYDKFKAQTGLQLSPVKTSTGGDNEVGLVGTMNTSELGKLNSRDLILGFVVAVGTAVFAGIADALELGVFADLNWKSIGQIGLTAALGYVTKNLLSDDKGRPLGI